jgi:phosphinothricin acetyltransferase
MEIPTRRVQILPFRHHKLQYSAPTALYDLQYMKLWTQRETWDKIKKDSLLSELGWRRQLSLGCTVNFLFKEANKFTVEHSVYVSNDFHGKGIGKLF